MSWRLNSAYTTHDYISYFDGVATDVSHYPEVISGFELMMFVFRIVRKPDHLMTNIVIPLYVLSIMACVSFLMPPKSGEPIGYIITVQLALTFVSQTVQEKGPPTGDLPPPKLFAIIQYITTLCILSLLGTVVLLYSEKQDESDGMTSVVRNLRSCKECRERGNRKIDKSTIRRDSVSSADDIEVGPILK